MGFLDVHAFSDALGRQIAFHVLLPQSVPAPLPVLWLLHGLSDDHTTWLRRTSIERYAAEQGLAVVMPAVDRSFYQDMANGARYWTFVSEELPALCGAWFPFSTARERNFAAGLSMGGYGALRLALAHPARYAAGASLSGALDLNRRLREAGRPGSRVSLAEWRTIFGNELSVEGTEADLPFLAGRVAGSAGPKPALFLSCGTEDELLGDTRDFHARLQQLGYAHVCEEGPGGHDWACWDAHIQRVLAWLAKLPQAGLGQ